jgi:hypothetical protein
MKTDKNFTQCAIIKPKKVPKVSYDKIILYILHFSTTKNLCIFSHFFLPHQVYLLFSYTYSFFLFRRYNFYLAWATKSKTSEFRIMNSNTQQKITFGDIFFTHKNNNNSTTFHLLYIFSFVPYLIVQKSIIISTKIKINSRKLFSTRVCVIL